MRSLQGSESSSTSAGRKRTGKLRVRRKSRTGCGNCKLRSVKCDENRPQCKRCLAYGVLCNYVQEYDDLQLSLEGAATTFTVPSKGLPCWTSPDEELLHKFQARTSMTMSTGEQLMLYQGDVLRLTNGNAFLKHAILTITLMHDRHLEQVRGRTLSTLEAYHWYQTTSKFSKQLSQAQGSVSSVDKQASFWTTAALLGIITFCHIEAQSPEEAWPLTYDSENDLKWLKISYGKNQMIKLTQDLQADRRFRALRRMSTVEPVSVPSTSQPIRMDVLNQFSLPEYRSTAETLKMVLGSNCLITIIVNFWKFVHTMPAILKCQLERKDPKALSLLLLWFTKLHGLPIWWLKRRTSLEGRALCIYLGRYHADDIGAQQLLQWPKQVLFSSPYR